MSQLDLRAFFNDKSVNFMSGSEVRASYNHTQMFALESRYEKLGSVDKEELKKLADKMGLSQLKYCAKVVCD